MLVLGHRGAVIEDAPFSQNSLPAFEEALAAGDGFETDACLSKDGKVFLIHEEDNGRGGTRLDQLAAADIEKFHLAKGEPIPTLQQAIDLVGRHSGKCLNIELKTHGVAEPVLTLLKENFRKKTIGPEEVLVSSFDHAALKQMRREMPGLKIGALFVTNREDGMKIFPSQPASNATCVALKTAALLSPGLRDLRPDLLIMPEKLLTEAIVEQIAALYPAAQLGGWTVSENDDYDQDDLLARLKSLRSSNKIAAMIVDDPRAFVKAWRNG
jgi:glycerophosphoryl diester phosphodiesterase